MRCIRCNAKWNNGNTRAPLLVCPVCETDYSVEPSLKEYSGIAEFLYELRMNNSDAFFEGKRVLAYLNDFFPKETEIRDGLKRLYDSGLIEEITGFLNGSKSGSDFTSFIMSNADENVRDELLELLYFALSISADAGTDFTQSEYYKGVIDSLNDNIYCIKALEKAIAIDDDSALKKLLIEYKIKSGDVKDAIKDIEKAAASGDAQSLYTLAVMYKDGNFYQKDLDKAVGLLKLASEKGNAAADYLLADIFLSDKTKRDDALVYLRKAADRDNVKAQCRLYNELYSRNNNEAINYLKKAAFRSYAPAMYEYSLHLLYGDNVDQDVDSAIKFLEEAASKKDRDAIGKLAYIYSVGYMVEKDINKAQMYKDMLRGE